jgi:hypothetical protein
MAPNEPAQIPLPVRHADVSVGGQPNVIPTNNDSNTINIHENEIKIAVNPIKAFHVVSESFSADMTIYENWEIIKWIPVLSPGSRRFESQFFQEISISDRSIIDKIILNFKMGIIFFEQPSSVSDFKAD